MQSQYTDTRPTSPCVDPITPGDRQASHKSTNVQVPGLTGPGKIPERASENRSQVCHSRGGRLTTRSPRRCKAGKLSDSDNHDSDFISIALFHVKRAQLR